MSWNSYTKPQRKIAERDISTYKLMALVLDDWCRSLMMGFVYHYDTLYSMPSLNIIETKIELPVSGTVYTIKEGFHSYIEGAVGVNKNYTVKCVIPKGSEYYIDKDEIVSNQIIIKSWH